MKLNPDIVPINLEEAIKIIKDGLIEDDLVEIKSAIFDAARVHFTVGMMIRNEWSLWDKNSILVRWFKENYGIDYADDISGLILDCLTRDIQGLPRRDRKLARQYIQHWKDMKNK
jgi:hypothetical protein